MGNIWSPLQTRETASAPNRLLRGWLLGEDVDQPGQVVVNEVTALGIAAYFAAIRNISEDIGKLPIRLFRPRKDGGKDVVLNHPLLSLLNVQFSPSMTAMTGWETIMSHALGWQGGYFEILRAGEGGRPLEMWPMNPMTTTVIQKGDGFPVQFKITHKDGSQDTLEDMDVFHLHGLGFSGFTGYIIARIGKSSIGPALAANQFRFSFFQNGATSSMVITVPTSWSDIATENFRKDINEKHFGSKNAYRAMILEAGATAEAISSDPQKSQLVQTLKFNVEDVARWFRIPPNKIGHLERATFSNIEEENRNYVIDTLQAWDIRVCQEIQRKLITPGENLICEHDYGMLLEADLEKRTAATLVEFQMGMWSPNELLKRASRDGIGPDGDKRFVLSGAQVLSVVGESAEPDVEDEPPEDTEMPILDDDERVAGVQKAFMRLFTEDFVRFIRVEEGNVAAAIKKGTVPEFLKEWYPKNQEYAATNLHSRVAALWATIGWSHATVDDIAQEAAEYYCKEGQKRTLCMSRGEEVDSAERFAGIMAAHTIGLCVKPGEAV